MAAVPSAGRRHARGALIGWQLVRVAGPSMLPTLRPGEFALVRRTDRVHVGDVVIATFDDLPGPVVVKRVRSLPTTTARRGGGVLADLRSDNVAAGGDSRTHGPGWVQGRVVRVGRGMRWRRPAPVPDLEL